MCACDSCTEEVEAGGSLGLTEMPALPNWQVLGQGETLSQKSRDVRCGELG